MIKLNIDEAAKEIAKQIRSASSMTIWQTNVDCVTLDDFEELLERSVREAGIIQARIQSKHGVHAERGTKENRDMLEYILGKGSMATLALNTFRRVKELDDR